MFRITPIGSCRVAGPLGLAQDILGFETYKARSYGYCHSSGEAVQMARFLQGTFAPPAHIWPLISRSHTYASVAGQTHDQADFYVVEFSSSKRITVDGVFIQLNYLTSAYAAFFNDERRAKRFWAAAELGDQREIDATLQTPDITDTDRSLLRLIRLEMTTPKQLRADITALQNLLPRLLIVTHVNALRPNGQPITSRAAFIDMVKDAALACNATVFDPTALMREFGQQDAIADYSEGLAHYTDDFAEIVVEAWAEAAIYKAFDETVVAGTTSTVVDCFMPHANALIEKGSLTLLQARLQYLTSNRPDLDCLDDIGTQLALARNDAQAIFDKLSTRLANTPDDIDGLRQHAEIGLELGQFAKVIDSLRKLDALHAMLPKRQLINIARRAQQWRFDDAAFDVLCIALSAYPQCVVVSDMIAKAILHHGKEMAAKLPKPLRQALLQHIDPVQHFQLNDLGEWGHSIDITGLLAKDVVEIATLLTDHDEIQQAADLICSWRANSANAPLPTNLGPLLFRWCSFADQADQLDRKIKLYNLVLAVAPQYKEARTSLRRLRDTVRGHMRNAAAANDRDALDALVGINLSLPAPLKEMDLYRARQRFESGDFKSAIDIGLKAAETLPENISVWTLLMRAAVKEKNLIATDTFAQQVIALADADTTKLEAEAVKCRTVNGLACAKAAQSEPDPQQAARLSAIAKATSAIVQDQALGVS